MKENYSSDAYVLVFKTNITRKKDLRSVTPLLNACSGITKWNVDLSDIDNVLRIEATHSDCGAVIELVNRAGYACEELTD
jgi:hypothetical protein